MNAILDNIKNSVLLSNIETLRYVINDMVRHEQVKVCQAMIVK